MPKHMHIVCGIAHRPDAMVSAFWAYAHKGMGMPLGSTFEYVPVFGTDIAQSRNQIIKTALAKDAEYVYFNDDDVIVEGNTMYSLYSRQKDMVTSVYYGKAFPPEPLLFRGKELGKWDWEGPYLDWRVGDFIRVDAAGCGSVLIHTKVFKAMKEPWFRMDYNSDWVTGTQFSMGSTEDLMFYKRAADLGFELWADTSQQLRHFDKGTGLMYHIPMDSLQLQDRKHVVEGEGILVDMGAGDTPRAFPGYGTVIRVDAREEVRPTLISPIDHVPLKDGFADCVFSCHSLEHFGFTEVFEVLREWIRILKVGGKLHIITPNLEWAARNIISGKQDNLTMSVFHGGQSNKLDYHKCTFTPRSMREILTALKLDIQDIYTEDGDFNIVAIAKKVEEY